MVRQLVGSRNSPRLFTRPRGDSSRKAIALDAAGKVQKFVMNDRCAAGTGQFLEMMVTALCYSRDESVAAASSATRGQRLSSVCSVFA